MVRNNSVLPTIDFFSGAGGMSFGFHSHPDFNLVAAVDAELAKPSAKNQASDCNETYFANCGVRPQNTVLSCENILQIATELLGCGIFEGVLLACPPCTDFTRAKPENPQIDGDRNGLTSAIAGLIFKIRPRYFVYENAREALQGNHAQHLETILHVLENIGYSYKVEILNLNDFGLPQQRERVILVASRDREVYGLKDLWQGLSIKSTATVGGALNRLSDLNHRIPKSVDKRYPRLTDEVLRRTIAIPRDGGSWTDIATTNQDLLIPSMKRKIEAGNMGSYKDVYGRMALNHPAPTIKRECSHVGNGRYTHPTEDRLLSVGEMAFLQGFPVQFMFKGRQLSNCYRQIGDAVPPLISHQVAWIISWIENGSRPNPKDFCLANSALGAEQFSS